MKKLIFILLIAIMTISPMFASVTMNAADADVPKDVTSFMNKICHTVFYIGIGISALSLMFLLISALLKITVAEKLKTGILLTLACAAGLTIVGGLLSWITNKGSDKSIQSAAGAIILLEDEYVPEISTNEIIVKE